MSESQETRSKPADHAVAAATGARSFLNDLLIASLIALPILFGVFRNFDFCGGRDWDVFEADLAAARRSILSNAELPLWMPYRAGGHDAFADPQSLWLSPIGIFTLIFDIKLGVRLFIVLCAGFGAFGALRLARKLELGRAGQIAFAGFLYISAPFSLYAAGGVPTFLLGFALLPWILYYTLSKRAIHWIAAGALLALDLYGGDINHFLFHSLYISVVCGFLLITSRNVRNFLRIPIIMIAAACLAAPKLVPLLLLGSQHSRLTAGATGDFTIPTFVHSLLDREPYNSLQEPRGNFFTIDGAGSFVKVTTDLATQPAAFDATVDWINVGAYAGWFALMLAIVGVAIEILGHNSRTRESRLIYIYLLLTGFLFVWFSFGVFARPSAWEALKLLPGFSTLRSPGRLNLYTFFTIAIFLSLCLDRIENQIRTTRLQRFASPVAAILMLILLIDVAAPAWKSINSTFIEKPAASMPAKNFYQITAPWPFATTFMGPRVAPCVQSNTGAVNGYGAIPLNPAAIANDNPNYRGEVFFTSGEGNILDYQFTSRRILFNANAAQSSTIIINQNWAPGWKVTNPNTPVSRHTDGRIAVNVPAGQQQVILVYTTPGIFIGILTFILFLGIIAYFIFNNQYSPPKIKR
ncbi:MAG: alpha-(1-_3)-arabinofuranosyltransferase family protein [Planctomycetota bacterium]